MWCQRDADAKKIERLRAALHGLEHEISSRFGADQDMSPELQRVMLPARAALSGDSSPLETKAPPRDFMRLSTPWPLPDVLEKLTQATEHLLSAHSCDTHGHELFRRAAKVAREILPLMRGSAQETKPEPLGHSCSDGWKVGEMEHCRFCTPENGT